MRNQFLHIGGHIDIKETTQHIMKRTIEYAKTLSKEKTLSMQDKSLNGWEALDDGWIKFDVNAAVSENAPALTMVARNKKEETLKVWAKMHEWCSPLQAEAITMLWAIQLALSKNLQHIIIEGDAKSCLTP